MSEHKQMVPPDYHRCLDAILSSPAACRTVLETLAKMTEEQARSKWSPWHGQEPPPCGPDVRQKVPAEVQLVALQAAYDSHRKSTMALWRQLSDIMDIPVMQESLVELIWSVRMTIERLKSRIDDLETNGAS
jgi:hypothetical protein